MRVVPWEGCPVYKKSGGLLGPPRQRVHQLSTSYGSNLFAANLAAYILKVILPLFVIREGQTGLLPSRGNEITESNQEGVLTPNETAIRLAEVVGI